MKKIVVGLIIVFILIYSINIYAQTQRESLNMLIDISPHVSLELGEDINISIDQPWQGGEVREANSKLYLKTNTEVEISWESSEFTSEDGKKLPVGIPLDYSQLTDRGGKFNSVEQPFGINTFLVDTANLQATSSTGRKKEEDFILSSVVKETKDRRTLQSSQRFNLDPGVHEFDIIVQYYWARESNWSQIAAGKYEGQITYTVSAVNDGSE